jgi:WD40 repeat protein/energy-coupling factor transporter ATP-binding protein EcfA2
MPEAVAAIEKTQSGSGKRMLIGRKKHLNESLIKLLTNHFVALIGESGSGKSTLLREGIVKAISGELPEDFFQMNRINKTDEWYIVQFRPGQCPLEQLAASLASPQKISSAPGQDKREVTSIKGSLKERDEIMASLTEDFAGLLNYGKKNYEGKNLLIIIDQFEDIFRYRHLMDKEKRGKVLDFINNIVQAVNDSTSSIYIAISIQSEYLGQTAGIQGFSQTVYQGQYFIPPLHKEDILEIYEQNLQQSFEEGYALLLQKAEEQNMDTSEFMALSRKEAFQKLIEPEEILNSLRKFFNASQFQDSILLFLSKYAFAYTREKWLTQFDALPSNELDSRDIQSFAKLFSEGAKDTIGMGSPLPNFVEHHLEEIYQEWGYHVDPEDVANNGIIASLEAEWDLNSLDQTLGWHLKNTRAENILDRSAGVLYALLRGKDKSGVRSSMPRENLLLGEIRQSVDELIRTPENVLEANAREEKKQITENFRVNLGNIRAELTEINQMPEGEEKILLLEKVNRELIKLESPGKSFFQLILKAITTREKNGLSARHPFKVGVLWNSAPFSVRNEKAPNFDELLKEKKAAYQHLVSRMLIQLQEVGLIDIIPPSPSFGMTEPRLSPETLSPEAIVDISSDAYTKVAQGKLQDWIREEAKNSQIYLQLVSAAREYALTPNENAQKSLLLQGNKLELNLDWRKEQIPTSGWAQRYDALTLEESEQAKNENSPNLTKALDYLLESQNVAYQIERDKKLKEERIRKIWIIVGIIILTLAVASTIIAIYANRQKRLANKSLFEVKAINLLEGLDEAGLIPIDSFFYYKKALNEHIVDEKNVKYKNQNTFLIDFLIDKDVIQPTADSSLSFQAIQTLVHFYLEDDPSLEKNQDLQSLLRKLKSVDDSLFLANRSEYHNYLYHSLKTQYEDHASLNTNISGRVNHDKSIFSLGSSPQNRTIFAFGDNGGKIFLCRKDQLKTKVLHSVGDRNRSNVITSINFHNQYLLAGDDGGKVHIYQFNDRRLFDKPVYKSKKTKDISRRGTKSPVIEQIFTYSQGENAPDDQIFILFRVSENVFITSVESDIIKRVGNSKDNVIGCGVIEEKLVIITQSGISLFSGEEVAREFLRPDAKDLEIFKSDDPPNALIFEDEPLPNEDWKRVPMDRSRVCATSNFIALADSLGQLYLARVMPDNTVKKIPFRRAPHDMKIEDISFHPDGGQMATVSLDGTAKIYFNLDDAFAASASGETEPGFQSDVKVRDNGSPMYYVTYNNDEELITTIDISVKVWPPDYETIFKEWCRSMKGTEIGKEICD